MVDPGNIALERFVRFCVFGPGLAGLTLAAVFLEQHTVVACVVAGVTFYAAFAWSWREKFMQTWWELLAPFYRPRAFANGWRTRFLQSWALLKERIDLQLEWWRDDLTFMRDRESRRRAQRRYENFLADAKARS